MDRYTALSFIAPEKVHFRYKLEGQDPDWKEVVNDREAKKSNLAPGNYRFRVTASNNSGVWNEEGAFLDFSMDPAYYQTNWFRASLVKRIPPEIATHLAEHYSDEGLTEREIEVLGQIADGTRNRDIAERLFISELTVKMHIKHLMQKLGATNRTQAFAIGLRRGIIGL